MSCVKNGNVKVRQYTQLHSIFIEEFIIYE